MVPKIPPLSYRQVHHFLHQNGFVVRRQSGSHVLYEHPDGRATVVPGHGRDIDPGLVVKILKDARIDPDALRKR